MTFSEKRKAVRAALLLMGDEPFIDYVINQFTPNQLDQMLAYLEEILYETQESLSESTTKKTIS